MTTLKPQLIRAGNDLVSPDGVDVETDRLVQDTLDLQNLDAPSAKDHTKQPSHPSPLGAGPAAPHQNQALRHAEKDALNDQTTNPQTSTGGFYDDNDDTEFDGEDGGVHDEDHEYGDQDVDDGLDDDLMDKISSSPSIDDGKYTLPPIWPSRTAARSQVSDFTHFPLSTPVRNVIDSSSSSSPFTSTPDYFPLSLAVKHSDHHHQGGYLADMDELFYDAPTEISGYMDQLDCQSEEQLDATEIEGDNLRNFLFPVNDPLLQPAESEDQSGDEANYNSDESDWEDEREEFESEFESDDDDSDLFYFTSDTRFIDSGWGGQYLRELEDIDFEFVYALHTFVATVEGQANATKGDTMVLLDDSNSYWWLVRVVKDGSIGKSAFYPRGGHF